MAEASYEWFLKYGGKERDSQKVKLLWLPTALDLKFHVLDFKSHIEDVRMFCKI